MPMTRPTAWPFADANARGKARGATEYSKVTWCGVRPGNATIAEEPARDRVSHVRRLTEQVRKQ
eukprot:2259305-Lingulodinium_polyedra.AAC.2